MISTKIKFQNTPSRPKPAIETVLFTKHELRILIKSLPELPGVQIEVMLGQIEERLEMAGKHNYRHYP